MSKKTLVEFAGIPGSGKTTIAKALYQSLGSTLFVSFPRREEYRRKFLHLNEKISLDLRYIGELFPYRFRRVQQEVRRFGVSLSSVRGGWELSRYPAILMDLANRDNAAFFILDEWLIHRSIDHALNLYPDEEDLRYRYVKNFFSAPLGNIDIIYVFVQIMPELALKRVSGDYQPYRNFAIDKTESQIADTLSLWEKQLVNVSSLLKTWNAPLLTINGSSPVEENVEFLKEKLNLPMS